MAIEPNTAAPYTPRERALIEAAYRWALLAREEGFDAAKFADASVREGLPPVPAPESSKLFQRLAAGKLPLAHAPPTRNGAPWYDVIESDAPQEIEVEDLQPIDTDLLPSTPMGYLQIEGAYWRILDIVREGEEYVLAYGRFPMRWRIVRTAPSTWILSREGLSAWVWQGSIDPNPFMGYPNQSFLINGQGPLWIVSQPESVRPNRWAWLRVEYDEQERVGRYVRFLMAPGSEGEDTERRLQEWDPFSDTSASTGSLYVVDRNRLGRILRAFHVPRSATPWAHSAGEPVEG